MGKKTKEEHPKPITLDYLKDHKAEFNIFRSPLLHKTSSKGLRTYSYEDHSSLYHDTNFGVYHFVTCEGDRALASEDITFLINMLYEEQPGPLESVGKGTFSNVYVCPVNPDIVLKLTNATHYYGKETAHEIGDKEPAWCMDLMTSMRIGRSLKSRGMRVPEVYGFSVREHAYSIEVQEVQWMERIKSVDMQHVLDRLEEYPSVYDTPYLHSVMKTISMIGSSEGLVEALWISYKGHRKRAEAIVPGIADLKPENMMVMEYDHGTREFGMAIIDPVLKLSKEAIRNSSHIYHTKHLKAVNQ